MYKGRWEIGEREVENRDKERSRCREKERRKKIQRGRMETEKKRKGMEREERRERMSGGGKEQRQGDRKGEGGGEKTEIEIKEVGRMTWQNIYTLCALRRTRYASLRYIWLV